MRDGRATALALVGLLLATVGLLVPGLHHIRCTGAIEGGTTSAATCVETFPASVVPLAAFAGLVGVALALVGARWLAQSTGSAPAARVLLGLGTIALLVPTVFPLLAWAWVGFDVSIAKPGEGCTGGRLHSIPLWIQHPTCVSALDLVATTLVALGGLAAALAAWRPGRRLVLASLGALGLALLALATAAASLAPQWLVPLAGGFALATSLALLGPRAVAAQPG